MIEDEKAARKSPPDSDRNKERYRDVSLSMAPLPIPLGPLGFGGKISDSITECPCFLSETFEETHNVNEYFRYNRMIFINISIVERFLLLDIWKVPSLLDDSANVIIMAGDLTRRRNAYCSQVFGIYVFVI